MEKRKWRPFAVLPFMVLVMLLLCPLQAVHADTMKVDALDCTVTFLENGRIEVCERWYFYWKNADYYKEIFNVDENNPDLHEQITSVFGKSSDKFTSRVMIYDPSAFDKPVVYENWQVSIDQEPVDRAFYTLSDELRLDGQNYCSQKFTLDEAVYDSPKETTLLCIQYTMDGFTRSLEEIMASSEEKTFTFLLSAFGGRIEDYEFHVVLPSQYGYTFSNPEAWKPEGNDTYLYVASHAFSTLKPGINLQFYERIPVTLRRLEENEKLSEMNYGKNSDDWSEYYKWKASDGDWITYEADYNIQDHAAKFTDQTINRTDLKNMDIQVQLQQDGTASVYETWDYEVTGLSVHPVLELPLLQYSTTVFESVSLDGQNLEEEEFTVSGKEIKILKSLSSGAHRLTLTYTIPDAVYLTEDQKTVLNCDFFKRNLRCRCAAKLTLCFPENANAQVLYQGEELTPYISAENPSELVWTADDILLQHSVLTSFGELTPLVYTGAWNKDLYNSVEEHLPRKDEMGRVVVELLPQAFTLPDSASENTHPAWLFARGGTTEVYHSTYYDIDDVEDYTDYWDRVEKQEKEDAEIMALNILIAVLIAGIIFLIVSLIISHIQRAHGTTVTLFDKVFPFLLLAVAVLGFISGHIGAGIGFLLSAIKAFIRKSESNEKSHEIDPPNPDDI